jgi:hypothetical protein
MRMRSKKGEKKKLATAITQVSDGVSTAGASSA